MSRLNVRSITIYLGDYCSLNCSYCRGHESSRDPLAKPIEYLLKDISDNLDTNKITSVTYVGGEPTEYMDDIYKIDKLLPHARKSIITNGINLPFEYYLEHKYNVILSHNGTYNLTTRGYDPFLSNINKYRYLSDVSQLTINTALLPTSDVLSEYKYFVDNIGSNFKWSLFGVISKDTNSYYNSKALDSYLKYLKSYRVIPQSARLLKSRLEDSSRLGSNSLLLINRDGNILSNTFDHSVIGSLSDKLISKPYLPKDTCINCDIKDKCHSLFTTECNRFSSEFNHVLYNYIDEMVQYYSSSQLFYEEVTRCCNSMIQLYVKD